MGFNSRLKRLITQHVLSDTPLIIRSSKTVIAVSGFTYVCGCRPLDSLLVISVWFNVLIAFTVGLTCCSLSELHNYWPYRQFWGGCCVLCPYSIKFADFSVPILNPATDYVKLLFVKKLSHKILKYRGQFCIQVGAYSGVYYCRENYTMLSCKIAFLLFCIFNLLKPNCYLVCRSAKYWNVCIIPTDCWYLVGRAS